MGSGRFISGKEGIAIVMDLDDPGRAAGEQARKPAAAVAPHRIDHDGETSVANGLEIDQVLQMLNVGWRGIELGNAACSSCVIEVLALDLLDGFRDQAFDPLEAIRIDGAAEFIADLEAVVGGGIMRGRDIDGTGGLPLDDRNRQ